MDPAKCRTAHALAVIAIESRKTIARTTSARRETAHIVVSGEMRIATAARTPATPANKIKETTIVRNRRKLAARKVSANSDSRSVRRKAATSAAIKAGPWSRASLPGWKVRNVPRRPGHRRIKTSKARVNPCHKCVTRGPT